jgi:hypothetical protein
MEDLATFADWHEHDGYLTSRQGTTWKTLEQVLASEQSLYESRTGETFVRQSYYPTDDTFLLRIYVLDEDEDSDYPGRWGDFGSPAFLVKLVGLGGEHPLP